MADNHECPNTDVIVTDTSQYYLEQNLSKIYIFCGDKMIAEATFDVAAFGQVKIDSSSIKNILKEHNIRWLEREVDRFRREMGHIDRTDNNV